MLTRAEKQCIPLTHTPLHTQIHTQRTHTCTHIDMVPHSPTWSHSCASPLHTLTRTGTHMFPRTGTWHTYSYTHKHTHILTCIVPIHTCIPTHSNAQKLMLVHSHALRHTHTHTHTLAHIQVSSGQVTSSGTAEPIFVSQAELKGVLCKHRWWLPEKSLSAEGVF